MNAEVTKVPRQMPVGRRKGGSKFPRTALADAVGYARKLVSKTHTAAQPQDVIFSGVVGAKGTTGEIRISALKQYGFLAGDVKSSFSADDLAKRISSAPPDELGPLYQQAVLRPKIFRALFDTFHGDTVSKAKLRQRAADLDVHPEETASCVDLYISGMVTAGLVGVDGEQVKHVSATPPPGTLPANGSTDIATDSDPPIGTAFGESPTQTEGAKVEDPQVKVARSALAASDTSQSAPRAVFNVSVTLDSSLDIEKLQRQLELLKRFGAI